jgi:TDG/mug DNA glycosylase family protein
VSLVHSFPPVLPAKARVLIVGSMPGAASLAAGRYYAHPRNGFWPIVGAICGFDANADYPARIAALQRAGIALWDVLQQCRRNGSLDSAIAADDRAVNDFAALFAAQPALGTVLCNGGTAHDLFVRFALPTLARRPDVLRLPSTSPAHAARTTAQKLAAWRSALAPLLA